MIKIKFKNGSVYYDVKFRKISDHLVDVIGEGVPQSTKGFYTYNENEEQLGDFTDFTTIYSVHGDTIRFSNNGSVEPMQEVIIEAKWEDEQTTSKRPNQVNITVNKNGVILKDILSEGQWAKTYSIKQEETLHLVDADDVQNYDKEIFFNTVTYTLNELSPVPPLPERVAELEEAVCELYEMLG